MLPRPQTETDKESNNAIRRVASDSSMSESGTPKRSGGYRVKKSRLIGMIDWTHVIGVHAPLFMPVGIVALLAQIVRQVVIEHSAQGMDLSKETVQRVASGVKDLFVRLYLSAAASRGLDLFSPAVKATALMLLVMAWILRRRKPTYLLSFATFKAPDSWKVTHDQIMEIMERKNCFNADSLNFLKKILARSGTGQATAWPPGIVQTLDGRPCDRSLESSRLEAQTVIFDIVGQALKKANVKPKEIDFLIINCSLFSPTPSLCAMVLSHFDMRGDVATYNLSGMGCAASLVSIDLAKQLLSSRPNSKALVVSTEIITPNFYHGNERAFLLQNTLFRCGGAAMVLSNSWLDGGRAWYKLLHTVRVQGTSETAYQCVYEGEDSTGERGVRLSKDIVKVAGKCMEKNFTVLGPQVLPLTEQALVVFSIMACFIIKQLTKILKVNGQEDLAIKFLPNVKPYVPDFKRAIDHFCIHAGGRAVIDGIEKNMKLEPHHTEASKMTLWNYGNTSSSSIWYELEYIQEIQKTSRLNKGDRILQVAFGSGFKCTSAVWLKL
mgnify:CR=1 FL=1